MTPEKIDYLAILADMKTKRSALDASITALEAAIASGTLGFGLDSPPSGLSSSPLSSNAQPMDLPSGAFLGKSMPDAIKLYLSAMRKRKTPKEIAAALQEGGMVSTSDNFESVVNASLTRQKNMGELLRFADGWGLAEWYPAGFRSSVDKTAANRKGSGKRRAPKKGEQRTKKETVTPGLEQSIETLLTSETSRVFKLTEIAAKLGIKVAGLSLCLGRMVAKQKAVREGDGYRAHGGNVQEMSIAS